MAQQPYEYRGLVASTWDLFLGSASSWEDTFFYRDLITRYGEPALDVGCGTGRLLLDYLASGFEVDGVDVSAEMLDICRAKTKERGLQPALFQQPMEALDLPRLYRTIMIPGGSFQLVTDPSLAAQAMARFFAHLVSGGVLVIPFMLLWQVGDPVHTHWTLIKEALRSQDGAGVRLFSRTRYEVDDQLAHTESRYEVSLNGEIIDKEYHCRSPAIRWYSQEQAIRLYQQAGFVNLQLFNLQSTRPAVAEDAHFVVMGEKPH